MPLTPATRLGPYEILAPLGAGGRGEVYRARCVRFLTMELLDGRSLDHDRQAGWRLP